MKHPFVLLCVTIFFFAFGCERSSPVAPEGDTAPPVAAEEEETPPPAILVYENDEFIFTEIDGTITIIGIQDVSATIAILPATINDIPIVSVSAGAMPNITRLYLPQDSAIAHIDSAALAAGANVIIPYTRAPHPYENMTGAPISFYPAVVSERTLIAYTGNEAFVYIPQTIDALPVLTIGPGAFPRNTTVRTVSAPYVTVIAAGSYPVSAFGECTALTSVSFPNVISIGDGAFFSCTALTNAYFPKATRIEKFAFNVCYGLTSVNFPNVTYIGYSAFDACRALVHAKFGALTEVGASAFYYCMSLASLTTTGLTHPTIGTNAFDYTARGRVVYVPAGTEANQYRWVIFGFYQILPIP